MVKTLKSSIKTLELGNKMRKDVWLREIERCNYYITCHSSSSSCIP